MIRSLAQVKEEFDSLKYQSNQIYAEAIAQGSFDLALVKCIPGTAEEKASKWSEVQLRLTEVGAEYDRLKRMEAEMKLAAGEYQRDQQPVNRPPFEGTGGFMPQLSVTLRQRLENSSEFKALKERGQGIARIDLSPAEFKALITLADISPQADRQGLVRMRMEERMVMDMLGVSQVNAAVVEWYEETTFTNAAAVVAEGDLKPEATLDWTLRTATVPTIAVWIPVTKQALQDSDFLEAEIRNRLTLMVRRAEENAAVTTILGTGGIQNQPIGADNIATAIFRAMQLIRGSNDAGFGEPDGIVMHPADFADLITLQGATTEQYLVQAILQNSPIFRLWGTEIRQTTAVPEGTVLVGAFADGGEVFRIGGMTVTASTEHADFFVRNQVAILAEVRSLTAVQVPSLFATVTTGV